MAGSWYILTLHLGGSHSQRWIMTSTRHAMSRHHCGLFVCLLYLDRRRSPTHPPLHAVVGRFIHLYCSLCWDDSSTCCGGVWYGPPSGANVCNYEYRILVRRRTWKFGIDKVTYNWRFVLIQKFWTWIRDFRQISDIIRGDLCCSTVATPQTSSPAVSRHPLARYTNHHHRHF